MTLKYPHLFEPIQINSLRFPNRIEIAPMGNGVPEICEEFGQSGASVMTLGSWQIDDEWSQLMGYPNPFIKPKGQQVHGLEGPRKLRQQMLALQRYGMYASVELIHAGRYAHNFPKDSGKEGHAIGPITETYLHKKGFMIHVQGMDEAMIQHVADNYAKAAVNFKNFGFDMIMLHFAHGWLPYQFLSPTFNKRTDQYGGSFENRARFPLLILKKVREAVGKDYPIELRVGAREYRDGGFDIDECIRFVQLAEPYIDLVHVSAGLDSEPELFHHCVSKNFKPHLDKIDLARQVKQNVKVPVVLVGSVMLPEEAEYAIASKACDLVAIGREAMVDPDWPKKAYEGRQEDIYPCLRCASCSEQNGMGCASNPRYGNYSWVEKDLKKAETKKHIVVIGGGPGGMRASITAAQRGHQVTLIEKEGELGGQIRHFQKDRFKTDLDIFCRFLQGQVNKYPIKVLLNTKATPKMVQELNPDALILALGAEPISPTIKGLESTQAKVMQAIDVYAHPEQVEGEVVIIGGGATGIETGIYLADEGHHVSVVEIADEIAKQEQDINWRSQLDWILKQVDCTPYTSSKVVEIKNKSVVIEKNKKLKEIKADTIVLSVGFKPRSQEADSFYGITYHTFKIGDCYKVRKLGQATNEGYFRVIKL